MSTVKDSPYECAICGETFQTPQEKAGHGNGCSPSDEQLLTDLRELTDELGRPPYTDEIADLGDWSITTYQRRFGSWSSALRQAGLEPARIHERVTVECLNCGATFDKKASHADAHDEHFCDFDCMGEWESEKYSGDGNPRYLSYEIECDNCGEEIERAQWQLKTSDRHFCDPDCIFEWRKETGFLRGQNSSRWRGGEIRRAVKLLLPGPYWLRARDQKRNLSDGKCELCGEEPGEDERALSIHHIVPIMSGGTNHEYNLMALCDRCHSVSESYTQDIFPPLLAEQYYE